MTSKPDPVVRKMEATPAVAVEQARGASMQVVLGPDDGTPNFVTRCFTIAPGGRVPRHSHDTIEHEQVVLEGAMTVGLEDGEAEVVEGDCLFIPAGVSHWYENRGDIPVRFLCVVPRTDEYQTTWFEDPVAD